jgi:hypothetical protein
MPDFSCCIGCRLGVHFLHGPHRSFEEIPIPLAREMEPLFDLAGFGFDWVAADFAG